MARGTDIATELRMELSESQNQRDKRIEDLWRSLNPAKSVTLDLRALQRGLRRIDHPLANADEMLRKIMDAADTNDDGKISYEEFHRFMGHTEGHLLSLFRSADTNGDGRLDKNELLAAYRRAGVAVPLRRLDRFFKHVDVNNDGFITFDEWRDFLLFMPPFNSEETFHAILSFYSLTPEGDSLVSDETLEGLGTSHSLLYVLFGSIIRLFAPWEPDMRSSKPISAPPPTPSDTPALAAAQSSTTAAESILQPTSEETHPRSIGGTLHEGADPADARSSAMAALSYGSPIASPGAVVDPRTGKPPALAGDGSHDEENTEGAALETRPQKILWKLTDFVPDPGYFLAGAIAGGVSRTATAPLDRLKVYLLVNTSATRTGEQVVGAIKGGHAVAALKHVASPFMTAVRELWAAGGARTFFAGNGLNVVKIMPETAIKFGSYEAAKRAMSQLEGHAEPRQISAYSKFAAGGVAGMISQFCVYPLDTLKFRLQCEITKDGLKGNALVLQTARRMFADGGFRAAYRGVTMGLVGMFPYSAIDMGTFEFLKTSYKKWRGRRTGVHPDDVVTGNLVTGVMGASSGAFGASIVYPLNVLRTRLQTQGTVMHPETYTGIMDVARKTVRREGYRALYKGLTPNLLKVAPALSITWMVYEKSKRMLRLD